MDELNVWMEADRAIGVLHTQLIAITAEYDALLKERAEVNRLIATRITEQNASQNSKITPSDDSIIDCAIYAVMTQFGLTPEQALARLAEINDWKWHALEDARQALGGGGSCE